jgi:hypothetical protein
VTDRHTDKTAASRLSPGARRGVLVLALCVSLVLGAGVAGALAAVPPEFGSLPHARLLTQTSASKFRVSIVGNELPVTWGLEWAEAENGPWKAMPNGEGTIPAAAPPELIEAGELTGLAPDTTYFVRIKATNAAGSTTEPALTEPPERFTTFPLQPRGDMSAVEAVTGTGAKVAAGVYPDNFETRWRFEYATSEAGPWMAPASASGTIAQAEAGEELHRVEATLSGLKPETHYFVRLAAENEHGALVEWGPLTKANLQEAFETGGAPTAVTDAVHGFHGSLVRALGLVEPHGDDTHIHFEYVPLGEFEAGGFSGAAATPEDDVGAGAYSVGERRFPTYTVGADLTGLSPGESYAYRVVASSDLGTADGEAETLTAPAEVAASAPSCPNESLRSGLSSQLPDCRAYEQLTPVEKGGTMDIGTYGNVQTIPHIAEDGERMTFTAPGTQWGESPDSKTSSYLLSRTGAGWQLKSLTPQPQAGANSVVPELLDPELNEIGVAVWDAPTAEPGSGSSTVELESGAPGGPYAPIASIPRADFRDKRTLVGESQDHRKVIISTADHTLAGKATGTTSGADLYEAEGGELRQLNVGPTGGKISTCGAQLPFGPGSGESRFEGSQSEFYATPQAISADGSRVFFEDNCTEHVYMRVNGSQTVDLGGPYQFLGANAAGTEVLLEAKQGTGSAIVLYRSEDDSTTTLLTLSTPLERITVSSDFNVFYIATAGQLTPDAPPVQGTGGGTKLSEGAGEGAQDIYRYDLGARTLSYVAQAGSSGGKGGGWFVSADGEYFYFASTGVAGIPNTPIAADAAEKELFHYKALGVYRFDAQASVVQCMSCASSFNPEPRLDSYFLFGQELTGDSQPSPSIASENGDYVFFDSTAALLPGDVDGEVPPNPKLTSSHVEFDRSTSSDTYEWRKQGIDGCAEAQGCLSLITAGQGGYRNELLGTDASGRDVFFTTHEKLLPQDQDTAGDIYDARIGGGFPPPPPKAVECEGDACSTPASAPASITPGSFSFVGPEGPGAPASVPASAGTKKCSKGQQLSKGRCVAVKRCPKGRRLVRGKCQKRKTKAKHGAARKSSHGKPSPGRSK